MKKTKAAKRLLLSVEKVRDLQKTELETVAGGFCGINTCFTTGTPKNTCQFSNGSGL